MLRQLVSTQRFMTHMHCWHGVSRSSWHDALPSLQVLVPSKPTSQPLATAAAPPPHRFSRGVAAAVEGCDASITSSSNGSSSSSTPEPRYEEWRQLWARFLQQTYEQGHFAADPGAAADALESNPGVMKRAVLSLARLRGDILHALEPRKVKALIKAGFPVDDRKTKNAHRRLQASILDGKDLAPSDGGPAELQDLMRVFLSLAGCDTRDASLFKPLMSAAMALLPDIMTAAAAEPPPNVAAQQSTQRYMPALCDAMAQLRPLIGSQRKGQISSRWEWQPRKEGAALPEAWLKEWRWSEGRRRSSEGRGGRGSMAGRGGSGGRTGGGHGGRGSGRGDQQQWQGPVRPPRQDKSSSSTPRWWDAN